MANATLSEHFGRPKERACFLSFGRRRTTAMPNSPGSGISILRFGTFGILAAILTALSGCVSEQTVSRFLVDPDRYSTAALKLQRRPKLMPFACVNSKP